MDFRYLFSGLVAWLLIQPIGTVALGSYHDRILGVLLGILLLVALWSMGMPRRVLRLGEILVTLVITLSISGLFWPNERIQDLGAVLATIYLLLSAWIGFRQLLADRTVTTNHLLGAMTVYLLVGIAWALMLGTANRLLPNAFRGLDGEGLGQFVYLSFVTLATLGFGDIVPLHPIARTLIYSEAVAGQFYVAILVANIVGRYVAAVRDER